MTDLFFDYDLPEQLIAQHPVSPRDACRLLVLDRAHQTLHHRIFRDLPDLLRPGDLLVLNNTRVVPARLVGRRVKTGGKWEGLFLKVRQTGEWEMLAQTRGYPEIGESMQTDSGLILTLVGRTDDRHWLMIPEGLDSSSVREILQQHGHIPLPPYIRKGQDDSPDKEQYQTVYAREAGSVAAPTAGLHFTPELLDRLTEAGIARTEVTLHVGLGTFAPITSDDPLQHAIHSEWCEVSEQTAQQIHEVKQNGGRIIAIGTTSTRTLETAAATGQVRPFRGETACYITPGHQFHAVDGLITNFHLPRTTLLLLVQALSGSRLLREAYQEAIIQGYRFYSYGDAMLVL